MNGICLIMHGHKQYGTFLGLDVDVPNWLFSDDQLMEPCSHCMMIQVLYRFYTVSGIQIFNSAIVHVDSLVSDSMCLLTWVTEHWCQFVDVVLVYYLKTLVTCRD